jgi:hypothetical protein
MAISNSEVIIGVVFKSENKFVFFLLKRNPLP